jgi:hypothetical protein
MKYPERVQEIVEKLASGVPHDAEDDLRRSVTRKIAEQCRFELGPEWGHKRADPGRPPSADVFAFQSSDSPLFVGWDWSIPGGVATFPDSIDLTGQVFIEVEPINHLEEPVPVPPPADLERRVARIEAFIDQFNKILPQAAQEIDNRFEEIARELARPLSVSGKTSSSAWHSHSVQLEIKRG